MLFSLLFTAFPYYGLGTSNGARPGGHDRVLHAFVCQMSSSQRKKGKEGADISSSSNFWTTRQLKDYLRKQRGRLSGGKSGLVSRQVIDALDNVRSVDIDRHSMTGESFLFFFFVTFS